MREEEALSRLRARTFRKSMTKAEVAIWSRLREANMHGFKFRRQHPIGPYVADFAHIRGRLVIEIDGSTHWTIEELAHDRRRDAFLRGQGWHVLRFTNQDVFENVDGIVEQIMRCVHTHPAHAWTDLSR